MKQFFWLLFLFFFSFLVNAQDSATTINKEKLLKKSDPLMYDINQLQKYATAKKNKKNIAILAQTGIIVSTLAVLNQVWYSKEPRQHLASFDDSREWLQMDKVGHIFSTYSEAKLSNSIWQWGGLNKNKSVLLGAGMAWLYQFSFELMDGTVATYGFSWSDVAANTVGASLFAFQELKWHQQRIVPKVSYYGPKYDPSVLTRVRELYGTNGLQRFLKDYNGQISWLSANLKSFVKKSNLPSWLNIAVGYSGNGMLGGFENKWKDPLGNTITRYDIKRERQWYLAPDVDFSKIKTNKKAVKILFFFLNAVKFPAPALLLQGGTLKLKGIGF